MTMKHTEEFKRETVRIALCSGLSDDRLAADMGIGKSTLGKWIARYRTASLGEPYSQGREGDPKKATQFFASQKPWGSRLCTIIVISGLSPDFAGRCR